MTSANSADRGAAPRCGACGYDTTGLTSFTCPECGADLRVAGITRGGPTHSVRTFVTAASLLLLVWLLCGMMLTSAVAELVPDRHHILQSTRLANPRSGGYRAIDIVATGSGWMDQRPTMRVELQLVPLSAGDVSGAVPFGAGSVAAAPPAPLAVSQGISADDVLAWLALAGISAGDPRVRDEAQAVALAAMRGLRTRGRLGSGFGWGGSSFSSSAGFGGRGGPFSSITSSLRGNATRSSLHTPVFAAFWAAVLATGVVFLWRSMRPRAGAIANSR